MSNLAIRPSALADDELIDIALNADDDLAQELAERLEFYLPCEPMCHCDDCLAKVYMDYQLEALSCGYDDVDPCAIQALVDMCKLIITGVAAAVGYEIKGADYEQLQTQL